MWGRDTLTPQHTRRYVHAEDVRVLCPRQIVPSTAHRFRLVNAVDVPVVSSRAVGVAAGRACLPVVVRVVSTLKARQFCELEIATWTAYRTYCNGAPHFPLTATRIKLSKSEHLD